MTLIKELIEIPEKVQRGDFVLNLSSGLADAAISQTLEQYVVTPQLQQSFDDALSFIKSTVVGNQNRQRALIFTAASVAVSRTLWRCSTCYCRAIPKPGRSTS
ncbi:hypothetical protein P4113_19595 [Pseudomonas aeruginosa]|nr:hypothetical protein [Pseudomonas aeruginosa]